MIHFPQAKINLGLNITEKRPDGYHNLETVFYPVEWNDVLEIAPLSSEKEEIALHILNKTIDGPLHENLVWSAWALLKARYTLPPVDVYLYKNIPFGAGLGGGSSDAAHMLLLLNEWASLNLSREELALYAAQLGADCPFFLYERPLFASGIGDQFTPIDLSLKGYYLFLVKPNVFVSTREAYSLVRPQQPDQSLQMLSQSPVEEWKEWVRNDFEQSVFTRFPQIATLKEKMYEMGALYAAMSGSGASVFGIFKEAVECPDEWKDFDRYAGWMK